VTDSSSVLPLSLSIQFSFFSLKCCHDHRYLHSFPTTTLFRSKQASYSWLPSPGFRDALYLASTPVLYSSCTRNSITFCEQSQVSASHTSFTSPRQDFSFCLYGKTSFPCVHILCPALKQFHNKLQRGIFRPYYCAACPPQQGGAHVLRQHQILRHRQLSRSTHQPVCVLMHPPVPRLFQRSGLGLRLRCPFHQRGAQPDLRILPARLHRGAVPAGGRADGAGQPAGAAALRPQLQGAVPPQNGRSEEHTSE